MGAGDNLGSAISKCFANDGYTVVAARRNGEKLSLLKNEIEAKGGIFYGYSLDARKEEDVVKFTQNTDDYYFNVDRIIIENISRIAKAYY